MTSRGHRSILSVLVTLFALSLAEDQTLTCYQCAGYYEAEPEDPRTNNPNCNINTFSPTNLPTVTNTSTDPTHPNLCFSIAVFQRDYNGGRPFTVRDVVSTLVPEDFMKSLSLDENAARHVRENWKMFIKGEMCPYDLCNDGTGAFNSAGHTSIAPLLAAFALCLHLHLM